MKDAEQRRRFLARLRLELRRFCVVKTYTHIEEMVIVATKIERVLGDLGETPYDPLDEEATRESSIDK
jgi:hypothetical protein